MVTQNSGGVNKLHYRLCETGELQKKTRHFSQNAFFDCGFGARASPRLVAWKPRSVTLRVVQRNHL